MEANFLTPVVTAFDKDCNLDIQANKNIWDYVIKGGVDGIVLMGSTGEFFAMPMKQKKELILLAEEYIGKRTRLLIGTSCMQADETIVLSNFAAEHGADGVMIIPPYYFTLSDESIEYYFDEIAGAVTTDIYLYNFPARTGYDLKPEVTLKLCRKHKNIVGYKDTVANMDHTRELIKLILPEFKEFEILSGFDDNFGHNVLSGGGGAIGGLSNVAPEICAGWVKAYRNNDAVAMATYQHKMDILAALFTIGVPFVPIVKKAMVLCGIEMEDYCTHPILQATDEQTDRIKVVLKELELIV